MVLSPCMSLWACVCAAVCVCVCICAGWFYALLVEVATVFASMRCARLSEAVTKRLGV